MLRLEPSVAHRFSPPPITVHGDPSLGRFEISNRPSRRVLKAQGGGGLDFSV